MKLALSFLAAAVLAGGPSFANVPVATTPARTGQSRALAAEPHRNRATPARPAQNRGTQNRATPARAGQNRATQNRATQNRATQNRATQTRATQNRATRTGGRPASNAGGKPMQYDDAKMNPASDNYDASLAAKYKAQQGSKSSGKQAPSSPIQKDAEQKSFPDEADHE